MNCTQCLSGVLKPSFIDGLFRTHTCTHCGGNWILIEDFVTWKERNPDHEFTEEPDWQAEASEDTREALLCPVTGGFMTKFKITAQSEHKIDYSASVGGIWLDKGEWDLLKSAGLASTLNRIVTRHWQRNIAKESSKDSFEGIYLAKFGQPGYEKIKAMKAWLDEQPNKAGLRAYLLAKDPYSIS